MYFSTNCDKRLCHMCYCVYWHIIIQIYLGMNYGFLSQTINFRIWYHPPLCLYHKWAKLFVLVTHFNVELWHTLVRICKTSYFMQFVANHWCLLQVLMRYIQNTWWLYDNWLSSGFSCNVGATNSTLLFYTSSLPWRGTLLKLTV